jgi:membrane protease subunit HflC
MEAERKSVANELRSEGFAESEKIKANAEKEKEIIITDAYREAQKLKGEGDAKAARIYSNVFNKNKEFYDFYRSIEAYRNSVNSKDDILVLDPNTEFFKYLQPKKNSTK